MGQRSCLDPGGVGVGWGVMKKSRSPKHSQSARRECNKVRGKTSARKKGSLIMRFLAETLKRVRKNEVLSITGFWAKKQEKKKLRKGGAERQSHDWENEGLENLLEITKSKYIQIARRRSAEG